MAVVPLPSYTPEFPITKTVKPRQRSAKLPEWGIEQRATSGLNQTAPEWNPRWILSPAEANNLDAFFVARASSGNEWILWTPPSGAVGLFRCDKWSKRLIACNVYQVEAALRQVFDISAGVIFDSNAAAYIAAVEAADGQSLETAVKTAINTFVVGCKTDGIWTAIKAACILEGARTLPGALVPLVGVAPTNNNFVSGDYNRKTGLVGDGSTKYLNSNRNNNADPQNSKHLSVRVSTSSNVQSTTLIGQAFATGSSHLTTNNTPSPTSYAARVNGPGVANIGTLSTGFVGLNRSTSTGFVLRSSGSNTAEQASTSATPASGNILVFGGISLYAGRLAFYSIGESLNLALLDARVTTLVNAIAAAIP